MVTQQQEVLVYELAEAIMRDRLADAERRRLVRSVRHPHPVRHRAARLLVSIATRLDRGQLSLVPEAPVPTVGVRPSVVRR